MINKRGTEIVIGTLYRFVWQTTLAHWYLHSIDGKSVWMTSKHGSMFRGNIDDLVPTGLLLK